MFSIIAARKVGGAILFRANATLGQIGLIWMRMKDGDPWRFEAGKAEILKNPLLE